MSYREIKEEYERAIKDPGYFDSKHTLRFGQNQTITLEGRCMDGPNSEAKGEGRGRHYLETWHIVQRATD